MGEKISFLIAAHNEEKMIKYVLSNLAKLPYKNFEVVVGLDGCTDHTLDIVKMFSKKLHKLRYFSFNQRRGKNVIINKAIKLATGDIIIIHDADWVFKYNKNGIEKLISCFRNPKIGGIAESFPVEFKKNFSRGNFWYRGSMWFNYLWIEYLKKNYTKRVGNMLFVDKKKLKFPFLTNIFKRKLFLKNTTLGDDFERTLDILNMGYEIIVPEDENFPRMIANFNKLNFKDIWTQKKRTCLARKQISKKYKLNFFKFYFCMFMFILYGLLFKIKKIKNKLPTFCVFLIVIFSFLRNVFKSKIITQKGWEMRAQRK